MVRRHVLNRCFRFGIPIGTRLSLLALLCFALRLCFCLRLISSDFYDVQEFVGDKAYNFLLAELLQEYSLPHSLNL